MKSMSSTVERRNEEEVLKILVEQASVGVCIMQDGKFCYVNSNFPVAIGYTVDELIGKDSLEIVVPEDREMVKENTIKMLKGEFTSPYQFRVTCKDGSIIWVMATVKSIQYQERRAVLGNYMEITGRKQIEDALKESEERYRELANSITDVFFAMDEHLRYTYWNKASEALTGIRAEDALGKSIREIFPDTPWRRRVEKVYRNVLRTQQPRTFVNDYDIDGRHHIFEISAYPSRGGISVFVKDITERKQAEETLQAEKNKLQSLVDALEYGLTIQDKDYNIIYQNRTLRRIFGDRLGEKCYRVYEGQEKVCNGCPVRRAFKDNKSHTSERKTVTPSGEVIFWENTANPIRDAEGRIVSCLEIARDITERKQAVKALRQSEERYRTILEEMKDAYFEVDLGGHLTFVNNATCRALGYSEEELIGMSYKGFTAEEDIEPVFRVFNEVYRSGVPNMSFAWKIVSKDGTHRLVDHSAFPMRNDKGEIIGFRGVGRDITERKRAEEKIRQSEENYRALFDSSVIGTLVVDAETMKVVMANQATLKMFGFSSPEDGINPLDFVPPEDRQKNLKRIVKEVFEKDSRKSVDLKAIIKDGREIWVNVTGARIMHKGKLAGLFSFTDITERKQAEEKLRQSEENYKTLFNSSIVGMYVLDIETFKVVMGNRAAAEMAGFSSPGEGLGVDPLDFVVPEDREKVLEVAAKEFEQDLQRIHEVRVIGKDDGIGWISISSARIMHDGKPAALVSFTNITERKQAEEKLRQSEENYRALFYNSLIGMFVIDAETMQVVMANKAAAEMIGFSSVEEGIGVNPLDFVSPEDRERVFKIITEDMFEQDLRQTSEFQIVTKDGREIWISAVGTKIMHEGRLAGLVSFTDITKQKKQREQLMMTDRLASLGELASGTAHELNNPLTSIIGFSQLLMEGEVPDDIRDDLKLINSEAQRAANVTKNLLTFARKHAPEKQRNQINTIIEDVLKLRAYEHKANGIKVVRHLAPDLPEVMVDYFQMQQVFMNIIINAEYFMTKAHNGGTLTITTKRRNGTVMISFTDDGPGIPQENLRWIFDPFFTTKEAGKGTGLGLSICHGIVSEHGGQIYVKDHRSKGATIVIELPINGH